jgi:hypothetical protein
MIADLRRSPDVLQIRYALHHMIRSFADRRLMKLLTPRRVTWILANVLAAILMPVAIGYWIERQLAGGETSLPPGFSGSTLVLAFTGAWLVFLLLLNVAMGLFVWLSRRH